MNAAYLTADLVDVHAQVSDWRARMTERVRFESDSVVQCTAVHEISLPDSANGVLSHAHGRVPVPIHSFTRIPAFRVRCYSSDKEVPVATRADERRACALWLARALIGEKYQDQFSRVEKRLEGRPDFVKWSDDITRAKDVSDSALWALDEPLVDGSVQLSCGIQTWRLWVTIQSVIPSATYMLEKLQNDRIIVALPKSTEFDLSPQCFVSRYHSTVNTHQATLYGVAYFLWKGWRRRVKKIGIVEFDAWRVRPTAAQSKLWPCLRIATGYVKSTASEIHSLVLMMIPQPRKSIERLSPQSGLADPSTHQLTLSDGSAMKIVYLAGRLAERVYASRMRWPWYLPDTTVIDIPAGTAMTERSYHFELEVPDGTYVHAAVLRVRNQKREFLFVEDDDMHHDKCHLHLTKFVSRRTVNPRDYFPAKVRVSMRPAWHNGLRVALVAQLVNAVILLVLTLTYGWISEGRSPVIPIALDGNDNSDALVAIISLAPTVAMSWIARQNEHMLTKLVQNRLRRRLTYSAVCSLASALAIALSLSQPYLFYILVGSTALCAWWLAKTAMSSFFSWNRLRPRRVSGAQARV